MIDDWILKCSILDRKTVFYFYEGKERLLVEILLQINETRLKFRLVASTLLRRCFWLLSFIYLICSALMAFFILSEAKRGSFPSFLLNFQLITVFRNFKRLNKILY